MKYEEEKQEKKIMSIWSKRIRDRRKTKYLKLGTGQKKWNTRRKKETEEHEMKEIETRRHEEGKREKEDHKKKEHKKKKKNIEHTERE